MFIPFAWGVDGPEGKDAYPSTLATAVFVGTAPEEFTPSGGAARGAKGRGSDRAICPILFAPIDAELPAAGPEKSGRDPGGMLLGTS